MKDIDPWVGTTLKKYRKLKGLHQEAFGNAVSQELQSKFGRQEKGLSKSTISRIEKGLYIPPQNKLEIMLELLDIQNPQERYRIFEACGYSVPHLNLSTEKVAIDLQQKVEQSPHDPWAWFAFISFLNQEKRFQQSLVAIQKASLALTDLAPIYQNLLKAKTHLVQYLLKPQAQNEYDICAAMLVEIKKNLVLHSPLLNDLFLKTEYLKTKISLEFKAFYQNLRQNDLQYSSYERLYKTICRDIRAYEDTFFAVKEEHRHITHFLYIEREKISLDYKWLEFQELKSLKDQLEQTWPELSELNISLEQIAIYVYGHLRSPSRFHQAKAQKYLSLVYLNPELSCVYSNSSLFEQWQNMYEQMPIFLENHQPLMQDNLSPEVLPKIPVLNTSLLYVLVMARIGLLQDENGGLYLNTLYFLADNDSLPTWHYVAACFYAFRYLHTRKIQARDKLIAHWMGWCQSRLDSPERFNETRFSYFLHEPCLWFVFLQCLEGDYKSPYMRWLMPKAQKLLEYRLHSIKTESGFVF